MATRFLRFAPRFASKRALAASAATLAGALYASVSAAAPGCEASSPDHRVALVELYTSEGCSSCPPADRWLSSLAAAGFGLDRVVPLALHVGYWDYIGWKDPYARAEFTERQRDYARVHGGGSIYTPQVVLDGHDYRGWHSAGDFRRAVEAVNARPAPFRLRVQARVDNGTMTVNVHASDAVPGNATLIVAAFEDRLSNRVTRGENRGETLVHDRVVRGWSGSLAAPRGEKPVSVRIDLPADVVAGNTGVAAFVRSPDGNARQALACLLH